MRKDYPNNNTRVSEAARAIFQAADRIDIIYAAKDVCRLMAKPADLAWAALKRLARYLKARPRMVCSMRFEHCEALDVYSDTDCAGCLRTRMSTSGGCVMSGLHMTKALSATQASLALSSGEA